RERLVGAVRGVQLLAVGDELREGLRRGRDPGLVEVVGPVDHDPCPGVVRHAEQLAVIGGGVLQAGEPVRRVRDLRLVARAGGGTTERAGCASRRRDASRGGRSCRSLGASQRRGEGFGSASWLVPHDTGRDRLTKMRYLSIPTCRLCCVLLCSRPRSPFQLWSY